MDSYVSPKDEIWFSRVCHHISNAVYKLLGARRSGREPGSRMCCMCFDFLVGPLVRGENKGKGKMSPYNRLRKPRGGVEVYPYSFFNLGARWDWMFNVTPRPLYPREKPGTHCIGGWVGLRAGLDWCGKSRPPP